MDRVINFYRKRDYLAFKYEKLSEGYSLVSITPLVFDNALVNNLDKTSEIVDISSLVEYNNRQSIAEQLFHLFNSDFIFACDYAKWDILEYDLRFIFNPIERIEDTLFNAYDINEPKPTKLNLTSKKRKSLSFYAKEDFYEYQELKQQEGFFFESITKFIHNPTIINDLESKSTIIDISSITEYNKIQSVAEEVFYHFKDDVIFICEHSKREILEYELRLIFDSFENVDKSILKNNEKELIEVSKIGSKSHKKIIDLNESDLDAFFNDFRNSLYGHPKFKDDFEEQVKTFRVFNKLGEHKILSLFLMGDSGVGKTEVARQIFHCLKGLKRLAKINFGNYSNEFSLSSLIGSARGYIGSDDGEIFMKVRDTDIGVLLIDEFEKSNATLFNYFLDVLESGKMTSSLGKEIDLNGFIIVFTSNISKDDFKKRISPELRSRFDYKCMFTLLSNTDKEKYMEFRTKSIAKKINADSELEFSDNLYRYLKENINVSKYQNMRDINKEIKKVFIEYIETAKF